MLRSADLPDFVFVARDGTETRIALADWTHRIRPIAELIGRRTPAGSAVGLMFTSEANLVLNWLACLLAGTRPLVMQYPTRKQSKAYWEDSVRNTIGVAEVALVIADDHCAGLGLDGIVPTIPQAEIDRLPDGGSDPFVLDSFAIIQLSSGTTGYRKAVQFDSAQLRRHVADFNASLRLGATDRIVSWLPLYHDMGYVACFVMPLMLGIPVVMMDPIDWVQQPEMLYGAIERHGGTVCYMPNFGFEVMARCPARPLPTMRWWISCSEPVSADTARKFLAATGGAPDNFAPCYAMAENIFAVSIRRGLETRTIDAVDVVSCGAPVDGVAMKVVEGELWVSSPTALCAYLGGQDIRDAEGYYPTGDLGELHGNEVFVTGRKQDLLIQAGKKYMLSDIDLMLNRLFPEVRGRGAALTLYDERLGTQKPLVLVEAMDFFRRTDQQEMADALKSAMGLDQIEVAFVPPRFLTKTSSGKINRRKSAENWLLVQQAKHRGGTPAGDPAREMRESFANVDWDQPVSEVLDSLSLTVLRIILNGAGLAYEGSLSLNTTAGRLADMAAAPAEPLPEVIRIVTLADRNVLNKLTEADLDRLARVLGRPVTMEHVCLPPAPIILSDLIFQDYFQPRLDQAPFAVVEATLRKLREASLIVVDDVAEMFIGPLQVYGVLSHNLERDPRADLVGVRWQRYPQHHHRLPLTVVSGCDLMLADRSRVIEDLSAYLGTPIFRLATIKGFGKVTKDWDYRYMKGISGGPGGRASVEPEKFINQIITFTRQLGRPLKVHAGIVATKLEMSDLAHYCSHFALQAGLDKLLSRFDSFCVVGQASSVPYLRREIERQGKPYFQVPSYAPEIIKGVPGPFGCMLLCGAQGKFPVDGPTAAVMSAHLKREIVNTDDPELQGVRLRTPSDRLPPSGTDWFYAYEMDRQQNGPLVRRIRQAGRKALSELRGRQSKARAAKASRQQKPVVQAAE